MKLSTIIAYLGGVGMAPQRVRPFAQATERLGYDKLWVGEPYGCDAATVMAYAACATERIGLGSAILAMPGRTPAMTAQTAITLDLLSNGRLHVGLGTSGPQVSEGWHGVRFPGQVQRTREYIEILRMAWRREELVYDGEFFTLPLPDGPGKPIKLISKPLRSEIPIYLAAMGPKNVALAGELADGWLPAWWAPEHAGIFRTDLAAGAAKAGRDVGEVRVVPSVHLRIQDDVDAARDMMRGPLALYLGGMGSRKQNFYKAVVSRYGFEQEAQQIQDLYLAGDARGAARLVPDELIDMTCLMGPVERVADRLQAYVDAGVDELIVLPAPYSGEDAVAQLDLMAQAAERAGIG